MELFDYNAARFWLALVVLLANTAIALYAWWQMRQRATSAALSELDTKISRVDRRVDSVEKDLQNQPQHKDLGRIHRDMGDLAKQMSNMNGTMEAVRSQVAMMNEYLMRGAER